MRIYRKAIHPPTSRTTEAADSLRQPLSFISREMVAEVFDSQAHDRQALSVCFTGHRHIDKAMGSVLANRLDAVLETLYQQGYRDFYCGGALGFDTLAAEAVLRLRAAHAGDIRLILALPCATQSNLWPAETCQHYERIIYLADKVVVLSPFYFKGCMQVRNRFMVEHTSMCVCYLTAMRGGTLSTVNYALQQQKKLLNIAIEKDYDAFICRK